MIEKYKNKQAFLEANYPNYSSCDKILRLDDLQKILDGELNGTASNIFINEFNKNIASVEKEYNDLNNNLYNEALANFKKK